MAKRQSKSPVDPTVIEVDPTTRWETLKDDQKIAIFKEWRKLDDVAHGPWMSQATRCYEYMESNQLPDELRTADPDTLYLCLNMIRNRVGTKLGALTGEKPIPHLEGQDLSDETGAAAFEHVFSFTARDKETRIDLKNRACARDMLICGMGVLKEEKNADRPVVGAGGRIIGFGDVAARRVDPLKVRIDCNFRMNEIEKIQRITEIRTIPVRELKLKWGDKVSTIKGKPPDPGASAGGDGRNQYAKRKSEDDTESSRGSRGRVVERLGGAGATGFSNVADVEEIHFLVAGKMQAAWESKTDDQQKEYWDPSDVDPTTIPKKDIKDGKYRVAEKLSYKVHCAAMVDDILLYDEESEELDELPFALYLGEEVHGDPLPVGEIYHLLHPQDLMNTIITAVTDNAVRNNNAGWMYEENALSTRTKQRLKTEGNSPGFHLEVKQGYWDRVDRIQPGRISDALYQIWNDIRMLFDELSSSYQVQRGGMPYETSGRGIIALQQSADMSAAGWHIAIEDALTRWARLRLRNIQKNYRFERVLRITDEFASAKTVQLVESVDGTIQVQDMQGATLLQDLSASKYDVYITIEKGVSESSQEKMEKAKFLYEAGVVDEEYLAKAFNIKGATEVVKRTKERDEMRKMGEQVAAAMQTVPQLQILLQQPELLLELEQAAQIGVEDLQAVAPALVQDGKNGTAGKPQMPSMPAGRG